MSMTIAGAKIFLEEQGYYTECLWRISDVMDNYECTEEQAHEVLREALDSDYITQEVWEAIDMAAEGLKRKEV